MFNRKRQQTEKGKSLLLSFVAVTSLLVRIPWLHDGCSLFAHASDIDMKTAVHHAAVLLLESYLSAVHSDDAH